MDRRQFLQKAALTTAATTLAPSPILGTAATTRISEAELALSPAADIEGHTLVCEFTHDTTHWRTYEDLRTRDGAITFVSPSGSLVLTKSAEAAFDEAGTPYLGL